MIDVSLGFLCAEFFTSLRILPKITSYFLAVIIAHLASQVNAPVWKWFCGALGCVGGNPTD
jgi:hypothetical protein